MQNINYILLGIAGLFLLVAIGLWAWFEGKLSVPNINGLAGVKKIGAGLKNLGAEVTALVTFVLLIWSIQFLGSGFAIGQALTADHSWVVVVIVCGVIFCLTRPKNAIAVNATLLALVIITGSPVVNPHVAEAIKEKPAATRKLDEGKGSSVETVAVPCGEQWSKIEIIPQNYCFSGVYVGDDDPQMAVRKNGWKVIPTTGQQLKSLRLGPDTQSIEYTSLVNHPLSVSFSTGPR